MVIYADILFIINAIITYFLLLASAAVLRIKGKRFRLLISSLLGGVYSFIIFANLGALPGFALKTAVCSAMVIISFGFSGFRAFLKNTAVFLLMNFLFAGLIFAVSYLFKSVDFYTDAYVNYININPIALIIFSAVAYVAVMLTDKYIFSHMNKSKVYLVTVKYDGREYTLNGFVDTGNGLTEPFSNSPVSLVKSGVINIREDALKRIVPYEVIGAKGLLEAVKADEIIMKNGKETLSFKGAYIAENDNLFNNSNYQIILNPGHLSEGEASDENKELYQQIKV